MTTLRIASPVQLQAKQWDFVTWAPAGYDGPGPTIEAILGGYASGKTTAAAAKLLVVAMANPWRPEYGRGRPQIVVVGVTARQIERSVMPVMDKVWPAQVIKKRWGGNRPKWLLINGCEVHFVSMDAVLEGETLCALWIDEIAKLAGREDRWVNYMFRLRDPLSPRLAMIVSGIPAAGWVRNHFDLDQMTEAERELRQTVLVGTRDNAHLPAHLLDQALGETSSEESKAFGGGGWMMPLGAFFSSYSADRHLVDEAAVNERAPAHVAIDLGKHAAIVLFQERRVPVRSVTGQVTHEIAALVIDEVITSGLGLDDQIAALRASRYAHLVRPGSGGSTILVDPTIHDTEERLARQAFRGHSFIKRERTDDYYNRDPGWRLMQAALLDARGNTRLHFVRRLARNTSRYGVINALIGAVYSEYTGTMKRDDVVDHVLDCVRYGVTFLLQPRRPTGALERIH